MCSSDLLDKVQQVMSLTDLEALRDQCAQVHVSDPVLEYIVRLVGATRNHPSILQGGSPRATLALTAMSRAAALVQGRDYVVPEDVRHIYPDVIVHRLLLSPKAEPGSGDKLAASILKTVPAPQIR